MKFMLISCSRRAHLGRNPNNGGSPPKDSRSKATLAVVMGDSLNIEDVFRNVVFLCINLTISAAVIII